MTNPTFTAGQRVYHRQRHQFGTYVEQDWVSTESIVDFGPEDDYCRITTAQLVPAASVRRIRDSEGGTWRRMDDSEYFMPEFAGGNLTLAEIVDLFGPVTVLDEEGA